MLVSAGICLAFLAAHYVADLLLPAPADPEYSKRVKRAYLVQSVIAIPGCALMGGYFFASAYGGGGTPVARWFASDALSILAFRINFGYTLYETVLYAIYGKRPEFWAHHLLGILMSSRLLTAFHCHQIIAWAGVGEITGVPLSAIELLGAFGMKKTLLYKVNGVALWFGFLTTRAISYAVLASVMLDDLLVGLPAAGKLEELDPVLRWIVLPATLFVWVLSCFWFYKITRGMLKALGLTGESAKPRTD